MFSGALFIQMALKWDMYVSLAVLLIVTGLYTVLGEFRMNIARGVLKKEYLTLKAPITTIVVCFVICL